eukprot:scaffold416_cov329-Pavlova_lutheri.AAC.35
MVERIREDLPTPMSMDGKASSTRAMQAPPKTKTGVGTSRVGRSLGTLRLEEWSRTWMERSCLASRNTILESSQTAHPIDHPST